MALRNLELSARPQEIKDKTLVQAADFQVKSAYRPPSWELVRVANQARTVLWANPWGP